MIPADILELLPQLPECTMARGWLQEPPSFAAYRRALGNIPDRTMEYEVVDIRGRAALDIFVDGTGLDPSIPCARLVAWGTIVAGQTSQEVPQMLSHGGVPGQWQTVHRAELSALLSAVIYAQVIGIPVRVWCDNQAVIQRAIAIQTHACKVGNHMNDHDLWARVEDVLHRATNISFQPIRSHQVEDDQPDWKVWAFRSNTFADETAAWALQQLPSEVHDLQKQVVKDTAPCARIRTALHQHFVRVGMLAIEEKPKSNVNVQEPEPNTMTGRTPIDFARVASHASFHAPAKLRFEGFDKVLAWLSSLSDSGEPETFVSWYELLSELQISTGIWGFQSTSTHGKWGVMTRGAEHGRPTFYKFQCWAMGLPVRLSRTAAANMRCWLESQLGTRQIHSVLALANLGPAHLELPGEEEYVVTPAVGLHRYWR
eukprot:Skav212680  [mRNA]  locus=scaffold1930:37420:38788:- [translate_table: standard]